MFILLVIWCVLNFRNYVVCFNQCSPLQAPISIFRNNTRLEQLVFETFVDLGLQQCTYQCLVHTNCFSFNYHPASGYCELNEENDTYQYGRVSSQTGFIHGWKREINTAIAGRCENFVCPINHKCIVDSQQIRRCESKERENIAFNKTTSQSSTYIGNSECCQSLYAVDNVFPPDGETFSSTGVGDFEPWWMVSFEESHLVTGVEIYNTAVLIPERLHDIRIEVVTNSSKKCCNFVRGSLQPGLSKINCIKPVRGNSLMISIQKSEILLLLEVRVFSISDYIQSNTSVLNGTCFRSDRMNVAIGRPVSVSALKSSGENIGYLVDGNRLNVPATGANCTAIITDGTATWLEIELDEPQFIESVVIYNVLDLSDSQVFQLSNLTVSLMIGNSTEKFCYYFGGIFGATSRILECESRKKAKIVKISTQVDYMRLCEVEVNVLT